MKFLIGTFIVAVSVLVVLWYINPTYHTIQDLNAQGDQYKATLQRAQAAAAKKDALVRQYNSFSTDDLTRIQKALPDKIDTVRLTIDVSKMALKYGAIIHDVKMPSPPPANQNDGKSYVELPLTFTTSLTYANFLSFLKDVEQNLRITDVSNVDLTTHDTGPYDFTFTLKSYAMK